MDWDLSGLDNMQKMFERFPDRLQTEMLDAMEDSLVMLEEPLQEPGLRPDYPIRWETKKQRKAFFATDGFGKGIPTKRTNTVVTSWKGEIRYTSTSMLGRLFNTYQNAGYVVGDPDAPLGSYVRQQSMFVGYWDVAFEVWESLKPNVIKRFRESLRKAARWK